MLDAQTACIWVFTTSQWYLSWSYSVRAFLSSTSTSRTTSQERAERMLTEMFEYFMKHTERLPAQYVRLSEISSKEQIICDYLSGMTDRYAIDVFEDLFIPETFSLGGVKV